MAEEAPPTLEGWFALHDVRTVDWRAWNALDASERAEAVEEAQNVLAPQLVVEDAAEGASALFACTGKGDLMLLHLRPRLEDLNHLERAFARTRLGGLTERTYTFVSVVELGGYSGKGAFRDPSTMDEETRAFVEARLHPEIPDLAHVSFYPMNKRREAPDNWYDVPFKERARMMAEHGHTGRSYAGRVKQIITGAMAFDDWEWGVTVLSDDPVTLKKMVAEMRYDEVSARYGEFGPFYLGTRLPLAQLGPYLEGEPLP